MIKSLVGRLHAKNYWRITLENKVLNHITNIAREKLNKRWKKDIPSTRFEGCTNGRNEEESCRFRNG